MPTIKGHKKIIKELISYGADINYQRPKEYGSDRELSYGENTALESAFISNDLEVIEFLLESGARITSHILQGIVRFPQIISVPSFALVQFLLDRNVDITKYNDNGNILHGVVWGTNMAKFLLKLGVNLNETTSDGETPLHLAIKYEQYERAKLLIKNGADLIIKDNKGNTPLDVCPTERILHDLKQYLKDSNYISQEIYQNICDPTLDQCLFNLIAFTQRCDPTKDMRIMKLLINAGANINARDTDGTPAAVHAARGGDLNFFQFYLEHGADITVCDAKGMNVLLSAICSGQNLSLINFILQKKVIDMYTKAIRDEDFGEENALDIILSNWKNDVEFNTSALNLLIENGFKIHETDLQGLANQAKNQFLELQDKITSSQEKDISLKTDDFLSQPDLFDTYNQITTNNLGHTFIQFGISSVSMECMGKNDNELDI
jgi:ankyrin repeat protein